MNEQQPRFILQEESADELLLSLAGDWLEGADCPPFEGLRRELSGLASSRLTVEGSEVSQWDAILPAFLLQCHDHCVHEGMEVRFRQLPDGVERLLQVATAVPPQKSTDSAGGGPSLLLHPALMLQRFAEGGREHLAFIGETAIALGRLASGRANTRWVDFRNFCYQAGPDAFAIISLVSILVGMILAYLGAVQLRQFGAEIYVADLVVVGMMREMGVLMTAVVMAGRTGAAYAAQLGTMQTNEEIDAITTMGISPMEFLVVPRMLALVLTMPLLTLYANVLGILGGAIVSGGMGITLLQYVKEGQSVLGADHLMVGLVKSVVFGLLIAIAGCRSGINSGRSSAAVGQAATEAVVTAVVYLIVADAAINILCQQLDI